MNLPLHKEAQGAQKSSSSHAGLWFDRFFNEYDKDWKVKDDSKPKWINSVVKNKVGDAVKLELRAKEHAKLMDMLAGEVFVMQNNWHFVTGMGNSHPVENGFAWHHSLGVPYLTGAAVKGLLRAWCEVWEDFDEKKINQWFGDINQSGELIFFDAIPTKPVQLKIDIMTPHYGDWYAKGNEDPKPDGSNVPADWHDPVPIPFLVVDKRQAFQFSIAKRGHADIDLAIVSNKLCQALEWLGAGSKTAVGYGRFVEDEDEKHMREKALLEKNEAEKEAQFKQQMEAEAAARGLTGLALDISVLIQQKGLENDKSAWMREAECLIVLVRGHEDQNERKEACDVLLALCDIHDKGMIANPDKVKGKKNKPVYKSGAIAIAKALIAIKQEQT